MTDNKADQLPTIMEILVTLSVLGRIIQGFELAPEDKGLHRYLQMQLNM